MFKKCENRTRSLVTVPGMWSWLYSGIVLFLVRQLPTDVLLSNKSEDHSHIQSSLFWPNHWAVCLLTSCSEVTQHRSNQGYFVRKKTQRHASDSCSKLLEMKQKCYLDNQSFKVFVNASRRFVFQESSLGSNPQLLLKAWAVDTPARLLCSNWVFIVHVCSCPCASNGQKRAVVDAGLHHDSIPLGLQKNDQLSATGCWTLQPCWLFIYLFYLVVFCLWGWESVL